MILSECKKCGNTIKAPDSAAGKTGKCKKCGNRLRVPQLPKAQVNVLRAPDPTNQASDLAFFASIVALLVCWVPTAGYFITLVIGAIVLILSVVGFCISLFNRGKGLLRVFLAVVLTALSVMIALVSNPNQQF